MLQRVIKWLKWRSFYISCAYFLPYLCGKETLAFNILGISSKFYSFISILYAKKELLADFQFHLVKTSKLTRKQNTK